jgi:hypothetical protein
VHLLEVLEIVVGDLEGGVHSDPLVWVTVLVCHPYHGHDEENKLDVVG